MKEEVYEALRDYLREDYFTRVERLQGEYGDALAELEAQFSKEQNTYVFENKARQDMQNGRRSNLQDFLYKVDSEIDESVDSPLFSA